MFSGRTAEARDSLATALRLDPRGPTALAAMGHIVMGYYFEHDYLAAEAQRVGRASLPKSARPLLWLAAALGQLGQTEEARKVLEAAISRLAVSTSNSLRPTAGRPIFIVPKTITICLTACAKAGGEADGARPDCIAVPPDTGYDRWGAGVVSKGGFARGSTKQSDRAERRCRQIGGSWSPSSMRTWWVTAA